ncbi:hypothetical protein T492DRAFT_961829, partial [Pavlovales sp. CCMP2436]
MSGVELLEVVQLRAGPGSGLDDWFVEHEQRGGGLGFTAGALGYGGGGGHGEQLDLFPPTPPRGGGQYSESDRFAPPGAIVLEPSAYQAWHHPAREQTHRPLRADAPDDDDISARVDELISALESDRLSFGFDNELPDARPPGGGQGGALGRGRGGFEAGSGSVGDARYGEELTPDRHEGASSPARRADGGRGWADSVSKPLDARADELKRREQHARQRALALTARLLDARSTRARGGEGGGGSGMPLLRAQLAELQGQLSVEAGRDVHSDAFFRAQLRRLHRLQAEASRLDAQTNSAGAKGAGVSEAARVSRQEELEALLQDLDVDEPDAYARFAPAVKPLPSTLKPTPRAGGHSLAPGWLKVRTIRRSAPAAPVTAVARSAAQQQQQRQGGARLPPPGLQRAEVREGEGESGKVRVGESDKVREGEGESGASVALRAILKELDGVIKALTQHVDLALEQLRAEHAANNVERGRNDLAWAVGSGPPSSSLSASIHSDFELPTGRGAAGLAKRQTVGLAGNPPSGSIRRVSTSGVVSRRSSALEGPSPSTIGSLWPRSPSASTLLRRGQTLIDAAQEKELKIANKWFNVWKEPLYSPMEAANEVDDAAVLFLIPFKKMTMIITWLAHDDGSWHAQAAASSAVPARSRSRSPTHSAARPFPSRAQPPRPQALGEPERAPAYVPALSRPPLAEMTVSSILGQAHTRKLLLRREAEAMGGLQTNLAEIESTLVERLLDEVLREQAGSLERVVAAVVDWLCESELGPLSSAPAYI